MSVPLPSPSPLTPASAKIIPSGSHPRPIEMSNPPDGSPRYHRSGGGGFGQSPNSPSGSPRSNSIRRHGPTRSIGFGSSTVSGSGSVNEDNWRERTGTTPSKSAVRTVGGFDKSKGAVGGGIANGVSVSPIKDKEGSSDKDKEKGELICASPVVAHIRCRAQPCPLPILQGGSMYRWRYLPIFSRSRWAGSCPDLSSSSYAAAAKKEVCQWFLKGNCKFGHKCTIPRSIPYMLTQSPGALAHLRPGEPMSMDRKNKKAALHEAREREGRVPGDLRSPIKSSPAFAGHAINMEHASPVPIKSALSTAIQSPPAHRLPSSPLRDPFGPPPPGNGSASPGFARSPAPPSAFASSPSRPSPLSGSVARSSVPGPLALKANLHSPLRQPHTAFSSSFSHSNMKDRRPGTSPVPPLSASFADGMRKNIWARSETPMDRPEILSPRRMIDHRPSKSSDDVFTDDQEDDEDGEGLAIAVPDLLAELLTPREMARRMSRRDSQDSFSASPSRGAFIQKALWSGGAGGERLAQSAGPTMGPGYLQGLWSAEGGDARKVQSPHKDEFAFGPNTAVPQGARQQSLLTQQRSPTSPQEGFEGFLPSPPLPTGRSDLDANATPFLNRATGDPSSPSARALQEHAPGQSLPGGLANALSRIHLQGARPGSGLAHAANGHMEEVDEKEPRPVKGKKEEHMEEGVFAMEG